MDVGHEINVKRQDIKGYLTVSIDLSIQQLGFMGIFFFHLSYNERIVS